MMCADLAAGDGRILFAVDPFNEGVDVPEIDTVLFLRPTESATVFLQQSSSPPVFAEGLSFQRETTVCRKRPMPLSSPTVASLHSKPPPTKRRSCFWQIDEVERGEVVRAADLLSRLHR